MQAGKLERAKIRVEHIIREDYMVEAMEVLEMYCDLLLARFGLIQQMKTLDDGLAEAISSIIWVSPRLQADVQELKVVADQFAAKYGKPYAQACKENAVGTVSVKLMHKLSVQAPPKITVEKYLIEIARYGSTPPLSSTFLASLYISPHIEIHPSNLSTVHNLYVSWAVFPFDRAS